MIAIAGLFFFASCGNKAAAPADPVKEECQQEKCCKELTEEQKAEMEAWKDWDNQTDEKKAELIGMRKACIEEKMGKCDAAKEECPEKAAKCAEFKAKWDNFDNLTIDEQKALIDEFGCCKKEGEKCCKDEQKEECQG